MRRVGDSVVGRVVWYLEGSPTAEIANAWTDGKEIRFDATFAIRDTSQRESRVRFTYRGALNPTDQNWIWGSCAISAATGGTPTASHAWNARREP